MSSANFTHPGYVLPPVYLEKDLKKHFSKNLAKTNLFKEEELAPKQEIVQPPPVVISQNQPDMTLGNFIRLWSCCGFEQGAVLHDLHLAVFQLNESVVTLHLYSKTCQLASFQSM